MRWIAGLAVLCTSGAVWGQHHHHHGGSADEPAGPSAAPRIHFQLGVSAEAGRVEAFAAESDYQGLALMVGASRGDIEAGAHMPFYRIDLGGRDGTGLGDVHLEGRWMGLSLDGVQAGFAVGVMPPFGDDDDGLGMGHWMVMTAAVARWSRGRVSAEGRLGYNGAIGGGGHAEHGVPVWPPVAPMNAHELALAGVVGVALGRGVGVSVQLSTAAPLGEGEFLALAGAGGSVTLGKIELGLGLRHGFSGHTAGLVASGHAITSF